MGLVSPLNNIYDLLYHARVLVWPLELVWLWYMDAPNHDIMINGITNRDAL